MLILSTTLWTILLIVQDVMRSPLLGALTIQAMAVLMPVTARTAARDSWKDAFAQCTRTVTRTRGVRCCGSSFSDGSVITTSYRIYVRSRSSSRYWKNARPSSSEGTSRDARPRSYSDLWLTSGKERPRSGNMTACAIGPTAMDRPSSAGFKFHSSGHVPQYVPGVSDHENHHATPSESDVHRRGAKGDTVGLASPRVRTFAIAFGNSPLPVMYLLCEWFNLPLFTISGPNASSSGGRACQER